MPSPLHAARETGTLRKSPRQPRRPRVFVGRKDALASLAALGAQVHAGRGAFALVCGEPGVGKTSLLEHLATRFDGLAVQASSPQTDAGPSYAPWRSIVDMLLNHPGAAALAPGPRAGLQIFAAGGAIDESMLAASFGLSQAIRSLVRGCGPTLITLDDHHWADPASRQLLERVATSVADLPVLLVVALRDGEIRGDTLARLLRRATLIHLDPFSTAEAHALFDALGTPPDQFERLLTASRGNPLLLVDMIGATGASETVGVSLAGQSFLSERIAALDPEALDMLRVLALIGHPLPLDELTGHLGQPKARVTEWVEQAVGAALLLADPRDPSCHDFVHDIHRQAVLRDLPAAARERFHLGIALELGADGDLARGSVADIAHHLLAAGSLADPVRVSLWCQRAGREAMARSDSLRAVEWFEAALRADGGRPSQRSTDSPEDRLLDLARAHVLSGNQVQADAIYAQIIAGARTGGNTRWFAQAVLGLAGPQRASANPSKDLIGLLEEALRGIGPDDLPLRAWLGARLASELYFEGRLAECRRQARSAVTDARRTGDRTLLLVALLAYRLVLWGPDDGAAQDAALSEILALLGEGVGDTRARQKGYNWAAQRALARGSQRELEIALARWRAEGERTLAPGLLASLRLMDGTRALMAGRLEAAEAGAAAITHEFADLGDPDVENCRQYSLGQLFRVHRERRSLAPLETVVRALVEEYPKFVIWRTGLAMLLADEGRTADSLAEIEGLRGGGFAQIPRDGNWLPAMAALAETAAALEHLPAARELLDLLAPLEATHVVVATAVDCWGSLLRFRGLLHEVLGETDAAQASFESALIGDTRAGNLLAAAHDQVALARLLGQRAGAEAATRAERLLAEAREFARSQGLSRLLGLVEDAARGPAVGRRAAAPVASGRPTATFRPEGTGWRVAWADRSVYLPATRGMAPIHLLLQAPGQSFPVRELAVIDVPSATRAAASTSELQVRGGDLPEPLLDRRARDEIRQRLRDLENEISSADEAADLGRAETLRAEYESILETLARGLDHRGRARGFTSEDERARVNVGRNIHKAIGRLRRAIPDLGQHLDRLITTGKTCCYSPDPIAPLDFILH